MDLGAHLGVFVDDVAVLENDVLDGNAHGESVGDFGRVDHAGGIGGGGVGGFGCGRILRREKIQNVAEVETVAALDHVHVEALHVDFAYAGRSGNDSRGVQVDAELFEGDKGRFAVPFQEGEVIYVDGPGQGAQAYAFDVDLSADVFFGVGYDVVLHEPGGKFQGGKNQDEQDGDDNQDNLHGLFHGL